MSEKQSADEPSIVDKMGVEVYEAMKVAHAAEMLMGNISDASFTAMVMSERAPALTDQLRDVYRSLAVARLAMMQVVNATVERAADLTAQREARAEEATE